MPPKRKARTQIPANAASAINYTDSYGEAANKRSQRSRPLTIASAAGDNQDNVGDNDNDIEGAQTDTPAPEHQAPAKPTSTATANANKQAKKGKTRTGKANTNGTAVAVTEFDHSRPEERSGIVNRDFYPAEMSNERCAMYNDNEIPRPMKVLQQTLDSTSEARDAITGGDAVIHWFKRDLRIRDNTALSLASKIAKQKGVGVIAVWIMSPQDWEAHLVSPAKCDFELRSLAVLKKDLEELDIPLYIEVVEQRKNLPTRLVELAEKWRVKDVFCNIEYEVDELRREEKLVRLMLDKGIRFAPQHDDCVVTPGALQTGGGRQYAVYSPWFRAWIAYLHAHPELLQEQPPPEKNPPSFRRQFSELFTCDIPSAPGSKTLDPEMKTRMEKMWPAGEHAAIDRLQHFLTEKIGRYHATRNFPSENSTARVSVHHAAGTLAGRTSVRLARDVNSTKKLDGGNEGIKGWISEVAWRDFYRHVLVNWPYVCMNKPFKYEYTNIAWETSTPNFTAWTTGQTGYPIVDAAMRCLNSTAYMHNRLRMVTASFLAKHLLLDWRLGEQYFISHLIDGDFASNSGGWGFSSSTGVDPQPYFRVFNPWLQSEKFDSRGDFIREWVPELKDVEGMGVHNPYEAGGKAEEVARRNGYPRVVVEHRMARERCLGRYKEGIGRGTA